MTSGKGKILVIRGGAIGDFILTLPVLAALRERFPQAELHVLGYPHIVQLALAGGLADAVLSIEARPLASFFAANGELDLPLSSYFGSIHIIVSYLYDPDGIFQQNVGRCTSAQFIAGPHRPEENARWHATEALLKPLERLAIYDANPVPRISLKPESFPGPASGNGHASKETASSTNGHAVSESLAVHPGSGSESKNWPENHWAELLARITSETPWNLLIIGGEAEGNRLDRLAAVLPADRIQLARNLPLVHLAHRMARCAAFLGHDSGISHLAGALGLQGLILWGDTNDTVWRPRSESVRLLRAPAGLPNLSVATVFGELRSTLGAGPGA